MKVVIIGRNECKFIIPMLNSLLPLEAERVWVCDRCTDNSVSLLKTLEEKFITTPSGLSGRQTSLSRNLGLGVPGEDRCPESFKYTCWKSGAELDDVLFLDGDRYPVKGDLESLKNSKTDITLLALEDDFRIERGGENYENFYGKVTNFFYSCGIFLKKDAIKKVCEFQGGELFSTDAQEVWGIEDTYLGDVCYSLGLTCQFNTDIRLRGTFEKRELDSMDVFKKRLEMRSKLKNVLW